MRASAREEVEDPSSNGVIGTAILRDVLLVVSRDHRIRVPLLVVAAIHKVLALSGKRHAASVAIDCRVPARSQGFRYRSSTHCRPISAELRGEGPLRGDLLGSACQAVFLAGVHSSPPLHDGQKCHEASSLRTRP